MAQMTVFYCILANTAEERTFKAKMNTAVLRCEASVVFHSAGFELMNAKV
jgi:hypothetical protein